jgi:hypothetical protein
VLFTWVEFTIGPMDFFVEGSSREVKIHFNSSRVEERFVDREVNRPYEAKVEVLH